MRNLNKEANIKIIGAVVICIAVVVSIFLIYSTTGEEDPYIPEPPEPIDPDDPSIGVFGQELLLTFKDGTTESSKVLSDSFFLGVFYNDKEVDTFTYKLKARASGSSQNILEIDYSGFMLKTELTQERNNNVIHSYDIPFSGSTSIAVDDSWRTVVSSTKGIDNIVPDTMMGYPYLAEGSYKVTFKSDGIIKYNDGGVWKNADSPEVFSMTFEVDHGSNGDLVVTFKGDVTVGYA
jgi:hypothetical protein